MSINLNPYDHINYSKNYIDNKENDLYVPEPGNLSYTFGTTDHQCYILDLTQRNGINERLDIQFIPDVIQGQRTANLKDIVVIGRNNPFLHYTGGKEIIQLPLEFYSDVESHDDVKIKIDWLRSLTINDGKVGGYRKVKIVFGGINSGLFRWETFAVKSVQYKMSHFDGNSDFLPLRATIAVSLQVDVDEDVTINTLRQ